MSLLSQTDPEISHALYMEKKRQRETVNLIASENYASQAVLEAEGSVMTNKYAEGYPQQRYYGGCENMDIVESLAIQRTKEIFHAEHANVQPHSGVQANTAAYFALLDYGDTVMAMSLAHGGPLMHAIAAKAVAFYEAMQPNFTDYQRAILDNALVLATELQRLGMRLISGGTDTHLVLVDLTEVGVTGREAEETLGRTGIVVNRNSIPFIDTRPSRIASGIRLGTPAVTSRGFGVEEMKHIAALVVKVITNISDLDIQEQVSQEVSQLCSRFPVPGSEG